MPWNPGNGDSGFPRGLPAELARKMREAGLIPQDADVEIIIVDSDGVETAITEVLRWEDGRPLPHTSFGDPPFGSTPEKYREMLIGGVREAEDLSELTLVLQYSLGRDMVLSHSVPVDTAMSGCEEFAARLFAEYRDAEHS